MFQFIKNLFIRLLFVYIIGSFGESLPSILKGATKCVSLNNQPCQARPTLVDINTSKTLFHLFTVSVNKCGESSNTIDDPNAQVCVSNRVKNISVKES